MKNTFAEELDDFFKDNNYDEVAQALFYLCPNEISYYRWQIGRWKKRYENKEATNE